MIWTKQNITKLLDRLQAAFDLITRLTEQAGGELIDDQVYAYQERADLAVSLESDGWVLKASVTLSNDRPVERNYILFAYCSFSNDQDSEWFEGALGENIDDTYASAHILLQEGKVIDHAQNGLIHFVYPVTLDAATDENTPFELAYALWVRQAAGGAGLIAPEGTIKVMAL